ncbi:MAG: hypothetical protein AAGJ32_04620 [Pseudomonadota bacterium]
MLNFLRKPLNARQLSWVTDTESLPDFGLSKIEMKLLAALVVLQSLVLSLLLL